MDSLFIGNRVGDMDRIKASGKAKVPELTVIGTLSGKKVYQHRLA